MRVLVLNSIKYLFMVKPNVKMDIGCSLMFTCFILAFTLAEGAPRRRQFDFENSVEADPGVSENCQELFSSFIPLRDAIVTLVEAYPDARPYVQYVQMSLNFPITSDYHWETLWCKVAAAKNFRQIGRALNIMIPPKQLYEIADHFKNVIFELERILPDYLRYHEDLGVWLNKTGFPDQWPIHNTNKQEVMTLMREGAIGDLRNVFLLGADPRHLTQDAIADILLDSSGVNEYVIRLGSEWLTEDTGVLATNMDWLRFMANPDNMQLYYNAMFKLFDFTRALDDAGILELL